MAFSSEDLLRQLDREEIVDWVVELKHGPEAYAFLMRAMEGMRLNVNQIRNGLHALFRIRSHGSSEDVLQIFTELANSPDLSVRSEAVQLAVGLVRFSNNVEKVPLVLSAAQEKTLRDAFARGLTPRVADIAGEFFV